MDGTGSWMGRVRRWDGCVGVGVWDTGLLWLWWHPRKPGAARLGAGFVRASGRARDAQAPRVPVLAGGLGTATPPRHPTSPFIKAANLIRAAPRRSRPVGAHQSRRGARVGGSARAAQLPELRKHPCN